MKYKRVIGAIDPGLDGGIAMMVLGDNAEPRDLLLQPMYTKPGPKGKRDIDSAALHRFLSQYLSTSNNGYDLIGIAIEVVHSMPAQGISSAFTFGKGYGKILSTVEILGIPVSDVQPQRWKKVVLDGLTHDKDGAIRYATNAFPKVNFKATTRCTKVHDGLADATCMCEYLRRVLFITDRSADVRPATAGS